MKQMGAAILTLIAIVAFSGCTVVYPYGQGGYPPEYGYPSSQATFPQQSVVVQPQQYSCEQYNCYWDNVTDTLVILAATGTVLWALDDFSHNYYRYGYRAPRFYGALPRRYAPAFQQYRLNRPHGGYGPGVRGGGHGVVPHGGHPVTAPRNGVPGQVPNVPRSGVPGHAPVAPHVGVTPHVPVHVPIVKPPVVPSGGIR
ncbi:MAG: hypothetical protein FWF46_03185 [Oscillospiraceae bacterium]|nr:hypothetical protein [Oscillospiraceae bacterium]